MAFQNDNLQGLDLIVELLSEKILQLMIQA